MVAGGCWGEVLVVGGGGGWGELESSQNDTRGAKLAIYGCDDNMYALKRHVRFATLI